MSLILTRRIARTRTASRAARLLAALSLTALSACAVGPNYKRPTVVTPPAFKEAEGWAAAAPTDLLDRGPWWTLFNDPDLNKLEEECAANNQSLKQSLAVYQEARALVAEAQASLFPTVTLTPSFSESGGGGRSQSLGVSTTASGGAQKTIRINDFSVGGTWAPDIWGKVRREVESARATAQSDYAAAVFTRLSMQTELASDYLQMRATDEEIRLFEKSVAGFELFLKVSENQYHAGTQARSAVLTAQSQLLDTQATVKSLIETRQQLEHAVAVLAGRPPSELTLPEKPFELVVPDVPAGVPSTLLERRPDVAEAERLVKSANAQIGVAVAAWYPTLTLNASKGFTSGMLDTLFNPTSSLFSFGGSIPENLFEGGLRSATIKAAKAVRDQDVASYRQTVLTAFQQVENELVALKQLEQADMIERQSSAAADENVDIVMNEYKAGTAQATDVEVAQQNALTERRNLITFQEDRLVAIVSLIEALGGGWHTSDMNGKDKSLGGIIK
jgi:NodT family efflux transporter outer membrane factor (OMF) lipoprotein